MESPKEIAPPRLLLRISEVAETLGIGRTKIYEMIATGELPTVRVGRVVRISVTTLQKWVEQREQQSMPACSTPMLSKQCSGEQGTERAHCSLNYLT